MKLVYVLPVLLLAGSSWAQGTTPKEPNVLWDEWFTVRIGNKHYAYYNEKVEIVNGQVHLEHHLWKHEEGFVNEEHLSSFSVDSPELEPILYNFISLYKKYKTQIDGTIEEGKRARIKVTQKGKELPLIRKTLPKGTFFSTLFPLKVARNLARLKEKKTLGFRTLIEDGIDSNFKTEFGRLKLSPESAKEPAEKGVIRLEVNHGNEPSIWWIEESGAVLRTEIPRQGIIIERKTEAEAKRFFEQSELSPADSQ